MLAMGIHEDVWRLFDCIGWKLAMKTPHKTYVSITLEVVSTLVVRKNRRAMPVEATFQLANQSHTWSEEAVNIFFRVPLNGNFHAPEDEISEKKWEDMADEEDQPYQANRAKATRIRNSLFRYIHRVLAMNVLARGDSGGVRIDELHMIWGMLTSTNVNSGDFFLKQLDRQAHLTDGNISIGGLFTPLALALGINFADVSCVKGSSLIEIRSLVSQHMIRPCGEG